MSTAVPRLIPLVLTAISTAAIPAPTFAETSPPGAAAAAPAWAKAYQKDPMTADEAKAFMKRLARFVYDNHLKKNEASPQRGMIYEYLDMNRRGQFDQFVQGEALDTMHDGAWFAAAMVNAYRATGDDFYKHVLVEWQLPFYCRMLNHSDELFSPKRNDARPGAPPWGKEWALREGEKGFVPYFWDDGGSVSLEQRGDNRRGLIRPGTDFTAGQPNPHFLLNGYSHGSSNHMAQDLAVMLQQAWLLLRDSPVESERKLAAEVAEAARNLHESRMAHHGHIPIVDAAAALANGDAELMRHVPDPDDERYWTPSNHYWRALYDFKPGQRMSFPGFADDQQYNYYHGLAKAGGRLTEALAFKTVYDAYTGPMLYRYYCDDAPVPPGINVFDLHPYYAIDGKPQDYRSDRKGPHGRPRPIGSRFGPQNMACCGWALQALKEYPGVWKRRYREGFKDDIRVLVTDLPPRHRVVGLTGAGPNKLAGVEFDLEGKRDVLVVRVTRPAEQVAFTVFSRPEAAGGKVLVTVKVTGEVTAVNDKAEDVTVRLRAGAGDRLDYQLHIPYTVVKGQRPWANGVEHGRYAIQIGDERRNFYLASPETWVVEWLRHELAGGLRTWEAVFDETGYIPTGIGTGTHWDHYSDSGGYAHLISAAAEWVLYLEGKNDWEVHNVPQAPSN